MALKKLFTPYQIGTVKIPNRLVVPAMVTNYCTIEGKITERYMKYIEEKAKGGWGLIITEKMHQMNQPSKVQSPLDPTFGMYVRYQDFQWYHLFPGFRQYQ